MKEEIEGITYLEFETFMKVNLRVGRIVSVEDHPNADKLYVVRLDDGTDDGRTICAGLKAYYEPEEMEGKLVVFVENLKPRPLRGVTSEGMMLAADDGNDGVRSGDHRRRYCSRQPGSLITASSDFGPHPSPLLMQYESFRSRSMIEPSSLQPSHLADSPS